MENKQTASRQAKAIGLKSLTQVSKMTDISLQTLTNWHKNRKKLFVVVLAGCKSMLNREEKA